LFFEIDFSTYEIRFSTYEIRFSTYEIRFSTLSRCNPRHAWAGGPLKRI